MATDGAAISAVTPNDAASSRFSSNASVVRYYLIPETPAIFVALGCSAILGVVSAVVAALVGPAVQIITSNRETIFTTTQLLGPAMAKYLKYIVAGESFTAAVLIAKVPVILVIVSLVKAAVSLIQWFLWEKTGEKAAMNVRKEVVEGYLHLNPMIRKTQAAYEIEADLSSTISNDVRMLREYIVHFYGGVPRELFSIIMLATTLILLSPKLFLIFVVGILPAAAVLANLGKKLRKRATKALQDFSVLSEWIQQRLLGIETIKHFRTEQLEITKMRHLSTRLYERFLKAASVKARTSPMLQAVAITSLGIVLIVSLQDIAAGKTTGAVQLSFFTALALLSQSAGKLGKYLNTNREASSAVDRLRNLLNFLAKFRTDLVVNDELSEPGQGAITLDQISVRYPGQTTLALNNVSCEFMPGKIYCLSGPSGAGKSTLFGVLLGLVQPESGKVTRRRASDHPFQLSYQPQKVMLLPASVAENVSYPHSTPDNALVEQSLMRVAMLDAVRALPQGMASNLGTGGSGLSGGQAQRIMLARLWYHKSPVILVDEGTSALDPVIEQLVFTLLKDLCAMGSTIISIAHRQSMTQIADVIIRLETGRIVDAKKV